MTNREKFTPGQIALLDQRLAEYDLAVNGFVEQAGAQLRLDGRAVATAAITDHLATNLTTDQLASVAAIALVRLAQQKAGA